MSSPSWKTLSLTVVTGTPMIVLASGRTFTLTCSSPLNSNEAPCTIGNHSFVIVDTNAAGSIVTEYAAPSTYGAGLRAYAAVGATGGTVGGTTVGAAVTMIAAVGG